jgi:predicted RNase H-like nuclease (RuvC/YqgF family)
MASFKWVGIGAQAAVDKTSLKSQLDSLATENSGLKAKVAELNDEIARLKAESSEAQERAKKDRLDAESREGELHQRLQISLDTLRSKPSALLYRVSWH